MCICVVLYVIKRSWITVSFGVMVPPAQELGHWVEGSDLTWLVFSQETLGGRQRAYILWNKLQVLYLTSNITLKLLH